MKYAAILIGSLLVACGGANAGPGPVTSTPPPASSASSDVKAPGDAKIGDRTHCPVSGEEFVVSGDSPHTDYQGKTYYFCCPHCVQKFEAEPAKYLGKPST